MEDLIKREDAIKYCKSKAEHYRKRLARIEAQGDAICYDPTEQIKGFKDEIAIYESFAKELEEIPAVEPKKVCIGLIRFDDEKLHEIANEAVKKLKEEIEPKQGEWKFISIDLSECSECGGYGKDTMRFCPNCGADMSQRPNHR